MPPSPSQASWFEHFGAPPAFANASPDLLGRRRTAETRNPALSGDTAGGGEPSITNAESGARRPPQQHPPLSEGFVPAARAPQPSNRNSGGNVDNEGYSGDFGDLTVDDDWLFKV